MERSIGTLKQQSEFGSIFRGLGTVIILAPLIIFPGIGFPIMITYIFLGTMAYFIGYDAELRYSDYLLRLVQMYGPGSISTAGSGFSLLSIGGGVGCTGTGCTGTGPPGSGLRG